MRAPDAIADALREARAALLNPALSESDRAHVVKVLEGALTLAVLKSEVAP